MAKIGVSLQELAAEITRRADAKQDFIAPASKFDVGVVDGSPVLQIQNGSVKQFPLNEVANLQLAEYAGIPAPYYRRMLADDPGLLASNVNRWLKDKPDRRMIRTMDGQARAVLSDKFRLSLENEIMAEAILPVLLDMNLMILSCQITDRRLYVKCVDTSIARDVPTGRKIGDGSHVFFDTVSPGLTFSNSEVGLGTFSIETTVYTRMCTNLAMSGTSLRKYHAGARAPVSDEVFALLSDDTKNATDRAVMMQVRDLVRGAFDVAKFDAQLVKLGGAAKDQIEPDAAVEVIERVGRKFSMNEGERKGILGRLIEGADLTRYGLHAAITRFSQDDTVAYDRATELERFGGEVIDLSPKDWKIITNPDASKARELVAA